MDQILTREHKYEKGRETLWTLGGGWVGKARMSPIFNVYINGVMKEVKTGMGREWRYLGLVRRGPNVMG